MSVLFVILGILLIAGGFSCLLTPLITYLQVGYFAVILIFVSGVFGIIRGIVEKRFGIKFVFDILSVLLGIVMISFPESFLIAEGVMLTMTAVWFILLGILTIITAVTVTKATGSGTWVLQLIFGILTVIMGGYSFFNPMLLAVSNGILISIFTIETGFTLMLSGFVRND